MRSVSVCVCEYVNGNMCECECKWPTTNVVIVFFSLIVFGLVWFGLVWFGLVGGQRIQQKNSPIQETIRSCLWLTWLPKCESAEKSITISPNEYFFLIVTCSTPTHQNSNQNQNQNQNQNLHFSQMNSCVLLAGLIGLVVRRLWSFKQRYLLLEVLLAISGQTWQCLLVLSEWERRIWFVWLVIFQLGNDAEITLAESCQSRIDNVISKTSLSDTPCWNIFDFMALIICCARLTNTVSLLCVCVCV